MCYVWFQRSWGTACLIWPHAPAYVHWRQSETAAAWRLTSRALATACPTWLTPPPQVTLPSSPGPHRSSNVNSTCICLAHSPLYHFTCVLPPYLLLSFAWQTVSDMYTGRIFKGTTWNTVVQWSHFLWVGPTFADILHMHKDADVGGVIYTFLAVPLCCTTDR